jgi:ribose transport system permease protein
MASAPSILSGSGGIDLSVAPLMGLINAILVTRLLGTPLGEPWFAIPIVLGLGLAVGLVNGISVAVLRFPAVIATLCMFFVIGGITLWMVPSPVTAKPNWTDGLAGTILGIPGGVVTIGLPLLLWAILRRTTFVETLLTIGDNEIAAFTSGIRVALVRVLAYGLGGMLAAVAGIALTGLVSTADPNLSKPYVLVALAAVAIGGVTLHGGSGGMVGPVLGAVSIYFLSILLSSLHVASTWTNVAYGCALLLALLVNHFVSRHVREGARR